MKKKKIKLWKCTRCGTENMSIHTDCWWCREYKNQVNFIFQSHDRKMLEWMMDCINTAFADVNHTLAIDKEFTHDSLRKFCDESDYVQLVLVGINMLHDKQRQLINQKIKNLEEVK